MNTGHIKCTIRYTLNRKKRRKEGYGQINETNVEGDACVKGVEYMKSVENVKGVEYKKSIENVKGEACVKSLEYKKSVENVKGVEYKKSVENVKIVEYECVT